MKRIAAVSVIALSLVGCATQVVSSNPKSVIVESQSMDAGQSQKLADAECAKYGSYARMTTKADYWDRNYVFDCVK